MHARRFLKKLGQKQNLKLKNIFKELRIKFKIPVPPSLWNTLKIFKNWKNDAVVYKLFKKSPFANFISTSGLLHGAGNRNKIVE